MSITPLRTVIVDDDPATRLLFRFGLERSGRFAVVGEAGDGTAGVQVAGAEQPDLVLLDLHMPGEDGLAVLPRMRDVCPAGASVVVVSGHPSSAAQDAVREGQLAAVLAKSDGVDQLVEDLLRLMGRRSGAGEEPALRFQLPAAMTSGSLARARLREVADRWAVTELLDELELLTTELVNNAVVHARSTVTVTVLRRNGRVRVEVRDSGAGVLARGEGRLTDTSGRGLLLVEALAADWGTGSSGDDKTVWFELTT